MSISKPSWLVSWLDWLNLDAGDWLDVSIPIPFISDYHLRVPPFSVSFGDWIEWAIDGALDAVDAAIEAIKFVTATYQDVYEIVAGALHSVWDQITAVYSDLSDIINTATSMLWSRIDTLGAQVVGLVQTVYDYVDDRIAWAVSQAVNSGAGLIGDAIDAAIDSIRYQLNLVAAFGDQIQDFFRDPGEYILTKLEDALDRFW